MKNSRDAHGILIKKTRKIPGERSRNSKKKNIRLFLPYSSFIHYLLILLQPSLSLVSLIPLRLNQLSFLAGPVEIVQAIFVVGPVEAILHVFPRQLAHLIWLLDIFLAMCSRFFTWYREPGRSEPGALYFAWYLSQVEVSQVRFYFCLVSQARYAVWQLMVKNVYVAFERLLTYLDQKEETQKTDFK